MMKLPLFEARTSVSGQLDTLIIAVFQDSGKKAIPPQGEMGSWIDRLRKADVFDAKCGATQFIRLAESSKNAPENVLFFGLGNPEELTEEKLRSAGGQVWNRLKAEKSKAALVQVDRFFDLKVTPIHFSQAHPQVKMIKAFAEGMMLSAYRFDGQKATGPAQKTKDSTSSGPTRVLFTALEKSIVAEIESELSEVISIGEAVTLTRDWSNQPSNIGTPEFFAEEAKKLARSHGLKCRVLSEQEAAREKMGLFLGVGAGSARDNKFVIVEYLPKKVKNPKTVVLVGKGVTFDSGGISIKPSMKMEDMKHDMTGAATVMGAILLAAQWKIPTRVIAVMPFTENMPSGDAIQPGNVLKSRNGKTVEIINTDAEGRLILADALDYAQDLNPDAIIDVATLTGAVSIALGKQCCAILGNDESLIQGIRRAGDSHGERIWELPLYDEYFDDLKSDVADMKNSANDGNGGVIRGAIFLKQFIKKQTRWAHLDIAAMAYNVGHLSYFPKKGATGAYVRTLARFLADF